MVSFPIEIDDLDDLPDHTDSLENLDSKPEVDGVLPRHLGNQELGRFVPAFTIVSGRTVQLHCLTATNGSFSFEKQYQFEAEREVEVWESLWEGKIAFHWPDRPNALTLRGYEFNYISQFTLNRPVPEIEDMTDWAYENLSITNAPDLPDCDHSRGAHEPVAKLPLRVASCEDCGMPMHVEYESELVGGWATFLVDPWWDFAESRVTEKDGIAFVDKRADTPITLTDVAVHLLSRAGHAEHQPFDYFLGDYNVMMVIAEETIAGYLTWNEISGHTILQSVYTRPEYRDEGLGSAVIDEWYQNICPGMQYYANEPNEGGFGVLNSLGHLGENGPATPVRVHTSSDAVGDASSVAPGQYQ